MNILLAVTALLRGFYLCLSDAKLRKLSLWPIAIGCVTYLLAAIAAVYCYHPLIEWFVDPPASFWGYFKFGLISLLTVGALVVAVLIVTITFVLIFTSLFQAAIASHVLALRGEQVRESGSGAAAALRETGRTIAVESLKILWLGPLLVLAFMIGLVPLLTPVALLFGSWLIAYQFADVVLDLYHTTAMQRFRFARGHKLLLIGYGLPIVLVGMIPFAGIFIAPAAAAGAAWLLSESNSLAQFSQAQQQK